MSTKKKLSLFRGMVVHKYQTIWIYPELSEYRDDKIILEGDRQLSDNSNIYYYKKVIKNTIQKYKKFLVSKKIDKINKDFQ